jgi:hypothetical protein
MVENVSFTADRGDLAADDCNGTGHLYQYLNVMFIVLHF